jgi:diaminopimelate decarboxylase
MASQYNSRPRAAEVLVDGDASRIIRKRESLDDIWKLEKECLSEEKKS